MYRLAIRYQLRSPGSRLTMEEAQILENKRNRLQKLIDMFERQADAYLPQPPANRRCSNIVHG
jgi:hypothetical protein